MRAPKCKICGKEHFGLCPGITEESTRVAEAIVDILLPPMRGRRASTPAKPKLTVIEGSPAEKLARAKQVLAEIEQRPAQRNEAERKKPDSRKPEREPRAKKPRPAAVHPPAPTQLAAAAAATEPPVEAPEPPKRKGNRHRPGYMAEYMRKRRAAAKEGKK